MPEPQPRNDLVPPQPTGPTDEEIRSELARTQGIAAGFEQENNALRQALINARREVSVTPQPTEDPLDRYVNDATLPTDKAKELLDRGVRQRIQEAVQPLAGAVRQEIAKGAWETENATAYQAMLDRNPAMADQKAEEKVAAAAGAVRALMMRQGVNLRPAEFYRRVDSKFREMFPSETPQTRFVEGGGNANLQGIPGQRQESNEPEGPNDMELLYGAEKGEINLLTKPDWQKEVTEEYVETKNEGLEKRGFFSSNPQVYQRSVARRKKKAAAAK